MLAPHRFIRRFATAACLATLLAAAATATYSQTMQLPADQRAFTAARSIADPEQRLAAMRQFLQNYPNSTRIIRAQDDIFDTLVKYFPQRTAEIDAQAERILKSSGKDFAHLYTEIDVADTLAEANDTGIDLPRAEKFAKDAIANFNEAAYNKDTADSVIKYKLPPSTPAALHAGYARERAHALAALAKINMDENKPDQATTLLDEAYSLDPTVDEVNLLRGELALQQHKDAEALEDFERTQLTGELKSPWREKMMELYRQAHNGSDAGFLAEMDARYNQLFPETFTPPHPPATSANRTVLLELFTGSACVGADVAVDALIKAYPRQELVALSFDQHIPEPDPLANPDSVARAKIYDIPGTPTYLLDGDELPFSGGSRQNSETAYNSVSKSIDAEASKPSGVQLHLTAERTADGLIRANASVTITDAKLLKQSLAPPPPKPTDGKPAAAAMADETEPTEPTEPELVVNFALVEDGIRYSGENGIRFHRMVVRALAQPADSGYPVEPGKTLAATFNPTEISAALKQYLDSYEVKNDRFGKVQFLSKDTTLQPGRLAIAAWVQDIPTHRIVQAAFIPLTSGEGQARAATPNAEAMTGAGK
jgi:hypothetical protein